MMATYEFTDRIRLIEDGFYEHAAEGEELMQEVGEKAEELMETTKMLTTAAEKGVGQGELVQAPPEVIAAAEQGLDLPNETGDEEVGFGPQPLNDWLYQVAEASGIPGAEQWMERAAWDCDENAGVNPSYHEDSAEMRQSVIKKLKEGFAYGETSSLGEAFTPDVMPDLFEDDESDPEKEAMKTAKEVDLEPKRFSQEDDLVLEKGSVGKEVMTPNGPGKIKKVYPQGDVELATEYADVELTTTGEIRAYPVSRLTKQAGKDLDIMGRYRQFDPATHTQRDVFRAMLEAFQQVGPDLGLETEDPSDPAFQDWFRDAASDVGIPPEMAEAALRGEQGPRPPKKADRATIEAAIAKHEAELKAMEAEGADQQTLAAKRAAIERLRAAVQKTAAFLANETMPDFEDDNVDHGAYNEALFRRGGGILAPHGPVLTAPSVRRVAPKQAAVEPEVPEFDLDD